MDTALHPVGEHRCLCLRRYPCYVSGRVLSGIVGLPPQRPGTGFRERPPLGCTWVFRVTSVLDSRSQVAVTGPASAGSWGCAVFLYCRICDTDDRGFVLSW